MQVGVVGPVAGDEFAENIADALRHIGHSVAQLGPAHPRHRSRKVKIAANLGRLALPSWDEKAQRQIAAAGLAAECELVINVDLNLMPSTVKALRSSGARVVFWFPDAVSHLARQLMIISPYDALFFKEPHIVERLTRMLNVPAYYLPEACNPRWHRPLVPAGTEPYLVIGGSMYPYRVRIVEYLISKGIPVRLYGVGVPRWLGDTPARSAYSGKYVVREEKAKVFRSAAGALNTMDLAELAGVNTRLFESAGSGAAVLTEFRSTLPDLFDIGTEVLAFHDPDELLDQATRLLSDPSLTGKLGDAASQRAHKDHSFDKRLATIFEKVL